MVCFVSLVVSSKSVSSLQPIVIVSTLSLETKLLRHCFLQS